MDKKNTGLYIIIQEQRDKNKGEKGRFYFVASFFLNINIFCFYYKFISVTVRRILGRRTDH